MTDFYEEDEPVEEIVAAFERGPDGVTIKPATVVAAGDLSEAESQGDIGAIFALRGDRYTPRGGVRHRTRPNIFELSTLVSSCGLSANESYWRGTGSQDEYERLASIPRCTRCIEAERAPTIAGPEAPAPPAP